MTNCDRLRSLALLSAPGSISVAFINGSMRNEKLR